MDMIIYKEDTKEEWKCGMCGMWKSQCQKNLFCTRTIIDRKPSIVIRDKDGEEIRYFTFCDATNAMQEFAEQVLLKESTGKRLLLIEKINSFKYKY